MSLLKTPSHINVYNLTAVIDNNVFNNNNIAVIVLFIVSSNMLINNNVVVAADDNVVVGIVASLSTSLSLNKENLHYFCLN